MSIGSEIRDERPLEALAGTRATSFSGSAVPTVLAIADGTAIFLSSLIGGIGYNLLAGNPVPNMMPYFGVGLLASIIHILQMNGKGFYAVSASAKPGVEIDNILLSWCTTGLLLALFAFLFKVGVD